MDVADVFIDAFSRIKEAVHAVLEDAQPEVLNYRPDPESNSIAWVIWHLTRVQDDHVAQVAGKQQSWISDGWAGRFALPLDEDDTGYGHSAEQTGLVRADAQLLRGYFDAVDANTSRYLKDLTPAELDRIVDERWDPPVTLGVRLTSVVTDDLQHTGQAAYVLGLARRHS